MTSVGVFAGVFDEQGHVLCVRHGYGKQSWGMPGGMVDPGEDPITALKREVLEETGVTIAVTEFVGLYAATYKDDLVILFRAQVVESRPWIANDEISEMGYFPPTGLPEPMHDNPKLRFADIAAGFSGVLRTLDAPGVVDVQQSLPLIAKG